MDLNGHEVTWLGHSAIRVRLANGLVALVDPWLTDNPSCPEEEHNQEQVDAIFVTHGHFDHLGDTAALATTHGAPVFAIHEVALHLEAVGVDGVVGSNKGGTVEAPGGIAATLVDAVHSAGISGENGAIAGGEAAGWILALPGGPTLYHAGDTAVFRDMSLIAELWAPDVAFLPIGGHFTMGPDHAARAARMLGASTVVPIHFGTFPILAGTPEELQAALEGSDIEVAALEIGVPVT